MPLTIRKPLAIVVVFLPLQGTHLTYALAKAYAYCLTLTPSPPPSKRVRGGGGKAEQFAKAIACAG